jgi:hypothetical protein
VEQRSQGKIGLGVVGICRQDGLLFGDGSFHVVVERGLDDVVTPKGVGHESGQCLVVSGWWLVKTKVIRHLFSVISEAAAPRGLS